MKMKIYIFILAFYSIFTNPLLSQTQTFVVTSNVLGQTGSIDLILPQAVTSANNGNIVSVLFNAPGLIQLDEYLAPINIANGALIFDKHPNATMNQGFEVTDHNNQSLSAINIFCSNVSTNDNVYIHIKDIYFNDFYSSVNQIDNCGIKMANSSQNKTKILVSNCKFNNNKISLNIAEVYDVTIENNEFISANGTAIWHEQYLNSYNTTYEKNIKIMNNYFPSSIAYTGRENRTNNLRLVFQNNIIENAAAAILLYSDLRNDLYPSKYEFTNNTIKNSRVGFQIMNPRDLNKITNNTFIANGLNDFKDGVFQIGIRNAYPFPTQSEFDKIYFDFTDPNNLAYPLSNEGNIFIDNYNNFNSKAKSFVISDNTNVYPILKNKINIIGYDLKWPVDILSCVNVHVRKNKINANQHGIPIDLEGSGNSNIPKPQSITANVLNTQLTVNYTLSGLVNTNGHFVVDFYKSNAHGDLLDYIGNQSITSSYNGARNVTLNITPGLLTASDRVALTVTSLGNATSAYAIGTSEIAYSSVTVTTPPTSAIRILKKNDTNGNGVFDKEDEDAAGVSFNLLNSNDEIICTTVTNSSGVATMNQGTGCIIYYGTYTLSEIVPDGYEVLIPDGGEITFNINSSSNVIEFLNREIDCCNSFRPIAGKTYWMSAWVKEEHAQPVKSYSNSYIELGFQGSGSLPVEIRTSGEIIDGWQRIVGSFIMPTTVTGLNISLVNANPAIEAFFDDIRIHPFNASMKSYVYDPVTNFLSAELDDNNYATFYEYDNEGQLIRIKKETARGIMTIQETRSNNPKN